MSKFDCIGKITLHAFHGNIPAFPVHFDYFCNMLVDIITFQVFGDSHLGDGITLQIRALFHKNVFTDNLLIPCHPANSETGTEYFGKATCAQDIAGLIKRLDGWQVFSFES